MDELVSRDAAVNEINKWLDYKRIRDARRDENEDNIEVLVEAMMYGDLRKEGNQLVQKLIEPLGAAGSEVEEITYDARVKQSKIMNVQTRNKVKANDHQALMVCYVAAITGESFGLIKTMVTEDWRIAQSIVLFFT